MAINKNHEFEDLDGIKCGIVEKNVSAGRVEFLRKILQYNNFTVIVVPSPPPKTIVPAVKTENGEAADTNSIEPAPQTFTVGVTDYTFNPVNAIFGRLLKTPDKHIVSLAYWQQKEVISNDEVPYFGNKAG